VLALLVAFGALAALSYELLHGDGVDEPSSLKPVLIEGPEETVFSWARDRCADEDIPDLPARAFRDASGRVQLNSAHYVNRRFIGPSLDRLAHPCDVTMMSGDQANPASFNDREWLASPYTADGRTVYALVHNEYQGNQHPGRCPSNDYFSCWYNAITLAVSRDGGRSFQDARLPPEHLVASAPYRYVPDSGAWGIFTPSNLVLREDGYHYALVMAQKHEEQRLGSCLMRTNSLDDPRSWRAWSGSEFDVSFVNPYRGSSGPRSDHICEPVSPREIGNMHESLTYNTYLDKYLLVGMAASAIRGRRGPVWGIHYSVSDDLISWSPRKLIHEVETPWTYECGDSNPILYPSVIDHDSRSRNFETTGRRPYLYFTRLHYRNCTQTLNRDLVRVLIVLSK
jgi:hypothetical protein